MRYIIIPASSDYAQMRKLREGLKRHVSRKIVDPLRFATDIHIQLLAGMGPAHEDRKRHWTPKHTMQEEN